MNTILLHRPQPMSRDLERVHLFPDRHLGEEEFDRLQAYADKRLEPILRHHRPGIIRGLEVKTRSTTGLGEGFVVSPGLAISANGQALGLFYPLRQSWQQLIEAYLNITKASSAAGVFYLTLKRGTHQIDSNADTAPCQRAEQDPTRDIKLSVISRLGLRRLNFAPEVVSTQSRERVENWAVANQINGKFLTGMNDVMPLGLVAIEASGSDYIVRWFSPTAGRYLAVENGPYLVLHRQINEAFDRVVAQAANVEGVSLEDYLRDNLQLDFLPSAGELPKEILQNPASRTPSIAWLPTHLGIDMVAVPEDSVAELIERHLARRVVDLRAPAGDRLRLLLAINEPDYRPDLLDFPQVDQPLMAQLFRYFMRAYDSWRGWREQFDKLYYLTENDVLDPEEIDAIDLPEPLHAPQVPGTFLSEVITKAGMELTTPEAPSTPYPYSDGQPSPPAQYTNWLRVLGPPAIPPEPAVPTDNGLVVRYSLTLATIESLDNKIRARRSRLEKTRDYLLLQRQQLDSQTVSLAALAGGVAGDGSGLQVARWLPYSNLKMTPITPPETATSETDGTSTPRSDTSNRYFTAVSPSMMNLAFNASSFNVGTESRKMSSSKSSSLYAAALTPKFNNYSVGMISTLEFGLNKTRLDRLAKVPKQALTKPAFSTKEYRFGVLDHIQPEIKEYKMAYRGMAELITTISALFDVEDAKSLKSKLMKFGALLSPEQLAEMDKKISSKDVETNKLNAIQARYQELFKAGKILIKQINLVEARYNRIEAQLERTLRQRIQKESELAKLALLIEQAKKRLEILDKRRIEVLGDYGVAQRLLDDDWKQVFDKNAKRSHILSKQLRGLYYVRVRNTPISASLADPLELRYGQVEDIVPGCDWVEDPELPEDLNAFFEAVQEVPMNDWRDLRPLRSLLPPAKKMATIYAKRHFRFSHRRKIRDGSYQRAVGKRLQILSLQNQSVLNYWSTMVLPQAKGSIKTFYKDSAQVISLEDLLTGSKAKLRDIVQKLNLRLEQCIFCLLEKLNEIAPSLRFQWAQLAEDDQIKVDDVKYWPGLERAEREDFNATRTVAELIAWWFRQLDSKVSATGRSAMRNMIRATLIYAALGDPAEIIHGQVHIPPRRFKVGEAMRLKLNRVVSPGTVLQLLDHKQRAVGLLTVDDHDEKGTLVNIVRVDNSSISINTSFRVVASKLTKQLL